LLNSLQLSTYSEKQETITFRRLCSSQLTKARNNIPMTVEEAIDRLVEKLPLKDRTKIAKMDKSDLAVLHMTIGPHIRDEFELWEGNDELSNSCRELSGYDQLHMDTVSKMIIDLLWARLRRTHAVRMVK